MPKSSTLELDILCIIEFMTSIREQSFARGAILANIPHHSDHYQKNLDLLDFCLARTGAIRSRILFKSFRTDLSARDYFDHADRSASFLKTLVEEFREIHNPITVRWTTKMISLFKKGNDLADRLRSAERLLPDEPAGEKHGETKKGIMLEYYQYIDKEFSDHERTRNWFKENLKEGFAEYQFSKKMFSDKIYLIQDESPSIFLSHTWKDKEFVRKIARELANKGVKVWIDEAEIKLGDSLIEKIRQGIDKVDYLAVVLSPDSVNSTWVQKEVDIAMNQEIEGHKVKVLPLMYRKCDLPWFLKGKAYADFTEPESYNQAVGMILNRLDITELSSPVSPLDSDPSLNSSHSHNGIDTHSMLAEDPEDNGRQEEQEYKMNRTKTVILFLGANPSSTSRLKLGEEIQKIRTNLKLAKERDNLDLKQEWAATIDSLMQAILDESPTIVHFSGHGRQKGIILQNDIGEPKLVPGEALADLFKLFKDTLKCVVLNACYSEHQANAIKSYIPYVIGMKSGISDNAAISFSTGFYKAIGAGRDIHFAFDLGVTAIKLGGFSGEDTPILL